MLPFSGCLFDGFGGKGSSQSTGGNGSGTATGPRAVPIIAWADGPTSPAGATKRKPEQTVCFSAPDNVIRLIGASGEIVAFEYSLLAEKGTHPSVRVALEDLVGEGGASIPASSARLYRHADMTVERLPAWFLRSQGSRRSRQFPDVLVPLDAPRGGQPIALESGKPAPVWVEIHSPPGARAGRYAGRVRVTDGGGASVATPVELRVRGYALPAVALPTPARVDLRPILAGNSNADNCSPAAILRDDAARRAIGRAFAVLQEHGLSPYTDDLLPPYTEDASGGVVIDWSAYDAVVGPYIDGTAYPDRRPAYIWPVPITSAYPDPSRYDGAESTRYAAVARDYLAKCKAHFDAKGWTRQAVVMFDAPSPEAPRSGDGARVKRLGKLTHIADKGLQFVSAAVPQSMGPFGWHDYEHKDLSDAVDIWCPPARFQHPPTLAEQRARGKRTWLLPDRPPFSGSLAVEAPWTHARSLPWQAFLHGHDGLFIPAATRWPKDPLEHAVARRDEPSDTWLIYPGAAFGLEDPVPSVRLKQLQLGLQDYAYLRGLADHGRAETARVTVSSLIKAAGTDAYGDNYQDAQFDRRMDSVEAWYAARKVLENELADVLGDKTAVEPEKVDGNRAFSQMLDATRKVRVQVESARLTRDSRPGMKGFLATFDLSIRSELPDPISGQLKFGLLPIDWQSVSDRARVGPVAEMGMARSRLVAGMSRLPASDIDGHYVQRIVFDAGPVGQFEAAGLISTLVVAKAPGPIQVDGSLADWPPTEGNVAGSFQLIAGSDRGSALPHSKTLAYFCRDADMLYIGVYAAKPAAASNDRPADQVARYGNVVTYEDLMPVGEDLVEILLDPTGAGAVSDDLYHVVIKASGQAIFERGIEMTPPIGGSKPWTANQKFVVESGSKAWTAEVAIPLSALGRSATEVKVWGLNVARFEPTRGEYANWAGARRHCYDPRTLGNLVWP